MESKEDRLIKQMKFIEEIDKEKLIGRQTYLSDASRKEMMRNTYGIWLLWLFC